MSPLRLACWMSEKKSQKINWQEFEDACERYGFELFKLDLSKSLESQGPFCVLLHKLTDIIAASNQGDIKSCKIIGEMEKYISENTQLIVIDPISNVRKLLDRYVTYSTIQDSAYLQKYGVFTPNFCELQSSDVDVMMVQLKRSNVTFPIICKPLMGHGSRQAHKMSIIFNEKSLIDCKIPCVAQSFINHNAVLYKIFIVGEKFFVVRRPSLKNYYSSDIETIHFDSSDVSKAGSQSTLSVLDPEDAKDIMLVNHEPNNNIFSLIANRLRQAFGMDLLGVDVVIQNSTRKYAIIDVNAYPGYDGFPNFFNALMELISNKVNVV